MCDNCNYNKDDINSANLSVCKECFKKNPSVLITQTNACDTYAINKKDLDNVRRIEYKGTYKTYLFLIDDVENIAINKYGSIKACEKEISNRLTRKKEKLDSKIKSRKMREEELNKYLKSICLPGIRSDSVLCANYIERGEKAGFTKEEIGKIMYEMKFYYELTDYSSILYDLRGEEIRDMRGYYGYYVWTHDDEEEVRERAKSKALYEYVIENFDDYHKCILEIPRTLLHQYNILYKKIKNSRSIKKKKKKKKKEQELQVVLSKYKESKVIYDKTTDSYNKLIGEMPMKILFQNA